MSRRQLDYSQLAINNEQYLSELREVSITGLGTIEKVTFVSGPVIIEDGKVLLVRKKDSTIWQFPGGTCLQEESFIETIRREVNEELNITLKIIDESFIHGLTLGNKLYILIHYRAQISSGTIKALGEIEEYRWQEIGKLDTIEVFDNIHSAVKYFKES